MSGMMGSGIYSVDADVEFECNCGHETCWVIGHNESDGCGHTWEATVVTDDWGNIDTEENCPKCGHRATFERNA